MSGHDASEVAQYDLALVQSNRGDGQPEQSVAAIIDAVQEPAVKQYGGYGFLPRRTPLY